MTPMEPKSTDIGRAGGPAASHPPTRRPGVAFAILLSGAILATWLVPAGAQAAPALTPQHWTIIANNLGQAAPPTALLIETNGPPNESVPVVIDGRRVHLKFQNGWAMVFLPTPGVPLALNVPGQISITQDVTAVLPPTPSRQPITVLPYVGKPPTGTSRPGTHSGTLTVNRVLPWFNHAWSVGTGVVSTLGGSRAYYAQLSAYQLEHAPQIPWRVFLSQVAQGKVPGEDTLVAKMLGRNVVEVIVPPGDVGPAAIGSYELTGGGAAEWVTPSGEKIPVTVSRYTSEVGTQVVDAVPVVDRSGVHLQVPVDTSAEVALKGAGADLWWARAARVGDVLGLASVAISCVEGGYEIVNQHNYRAGAKDLGEAVGATLSFESVGWGMAIGGMIGDGPGVLVGAVLGFGVGIAMPWIGGQVAVGVGSVLAQWFHWPWGSEANQANAYAPDLFFVNHTGRTVVASVTETGPGTHNVVPPWTAPFAWQGSITSTGAFVLNGTSRAVPYLHYEASGLGLWQTHRGWLIPASTFSSWATATLAQYGFPQRAITQFVHRWHMLALTPGWLAIYPQTAPATLDAMAPLATTPAMPLHRVWFAIQRVAGAPMAHPVSTPVVIPFAQGRLSAWEWGVTFLGGFPIPTATQGGHS